MPEKNHQVEIPEFYLLTIAVYGNMGEGELPDLMQIWSKKECIRLGLQDELAKLQTEKRDELKRRLSNVLGESFVGEIESMVSDTFTA